MRKLIASFKYAFKGIYLLFRHEVNARIELAIAIVTVAAGFYFKINSTEWLVILLCIGWVLSLEGINTAIEWMLDKIHPERHKEIGRIKDVAAGAVLVASIVSVLVAMLIFYPKIIELVRA